VTPLSRRPRRAVAAGLAVLAAGAMLTACDKPQPTITVFSGSTSKAIKAQPPCVFSGTCDADQKKIRTLAVASGSTILIDVPKDLANAGWIASAFTQDAGKNTPVVGAGTSTTKSFSERLQVPQGSGGYFVQVSALKPTNQLTTWVLRVQYGQ
jgi:hypothetical protein